MEWLRFVADPIVGSGRLVLSETTRFVSGGQPDELARSQAIEKVETQLSECYVGPIRAAFGASDRAFFIVICALILVFSFLNGQALALNICCCLCGKCCRRRRQSDVDTADLITGLGSGTLNFTVFLGGLKP